MTYLLPNESYTDIQCKLKQWKKCPFTLVTLTYSYMIRQICIWMKQWIRCPLPQITCTVLIPYLEKQQDESAVCGNMEQWICIVHKSFTQAVFAKANGILQINTVKYEVTHECFKTHIIKLRYSLTNVHKFEEMQTSLYLQYDQISMIKELLKCHHLLAIYYQWVWGIYVKIWGYIRV